jgi:co-chaperonin GroES (HSP10)
MSDLKSYEEREAQRKAIPVRELTSMWMTRRDTTTGQPIADLAIEPSEDMVFVRQAETPNVTESGLVTATQSQKEFYGTIVALGRYVYQNTEYRLGDLVLLNPVGSIPINIGEDKDKKPLNYLVVTTDDIVGKLVRIDPQEMDLMTEGPTPVAAEEPETPAD